MRSFLLAFFCFVYCSCATFRTTELSEGNQIYGKGRIYLYDGKNLEYLDFFFIYEGRKLKIEGLSIIGTPIFQIFISDKTFLLLPRSESYWEGSLIELSKYFLKKEISENDILSVFSENRSSSLEIKGYFKRTNFPKDIIWKGEGLEGRIGIKWIKKGSNLNLDFKISNSFRKVSLEEIVI